MSEEEAKKDLKLLIADIEEEKEKEDQNKKMVEHLIKQYTSV